MPMTLQCPNPECAKTSVVPETVVGRNVRCKHCRRTFVARPTVDDRVCGQPTEVGPAIAAVGRFQVRAILGTGAFGTVYRAYDPQLDREVAVKVPHPGVLKDAKRVERFLREAKAAARLKHPNIVPVYEAGQDGERHFIASAFIDGPALADAASGLTPRRAVEIVRALAEAVAYAHRQGVVHRDIKPDNVLLDAEGAPHLTDFGLASRADEAERLTLDGTLLGTPAYMAPEQAAGRHGEVQPSVDQYSLGATLYELLTGEPPFRGPTAVVLTNVLHTVPTDPRMRRPTLHPDLAAACLKALAKKPEDRYADCQALADDLGRWLSRGAPDAASPEDRWRGWWRSRWAAVAAAALAAVVVLTITLRPTSVPQPKAVAMTPSPVDEASEPVVNVPAVKELAAQPVPPPADPPVPFGPHLDPETEARQTLDQARRRPCESATLVQACDRYLELRPDDVAVLWIRADALRSQLRHDDAARAYTDLAQRSAGPAQTAAYLARARARQEAGHSAPAIDDYREVLKRDPTLQQCTFHIAECRADLRQFAEAIADATEALGDAEARTKLAPRPRAEWYTLRAWVYSQLRDEANARADAARARMLDTGLAVDSRARAVDAFLAKAPAPDAKAVDDAPVPSGIRSIGRYTGHSGRVQCLGVSADAYRAWSAARDGRLQVWSLSSPFQKQADGPCVAPARALAFPADGGPAVYAGERTPEADYPIVGVDFTTGGVETVVQKFRLAGHTAPVTGLAHFTSVGSSLLLSGSEDGTLRTWNPRSPLPVLTIKVGEPVECVDVQPGKRLVAAGTKDGSVALWNLDTGAFVRPLSGHVGSVTGVAFTQNGTNVVTAGADGTLRLWEVESGREVRRFVHPYAITGLAVVADGWRAVTVGDVWPLHGKSCVRLINLQSGKLLGQFLGNTNYTCVKLARDGRLGVVGDPAGVVHVVELPK